MPPQNPLNPQSPPPPPPTQQPKPDTAQFYGKVSSADPLAGQKTQYDFITNPTQPAAAQAKAGLFKLSKPIRIAIGAVVALILFIIVSTIIGGLDDGKYQSYTDLLSRSTEIIRVGKKAEKDIRDSDTRALLSTTNTTVASEQAQIAAYLAKVGEKVDPKQLGGYHNATTDQGLASAVQNSNLDEVYITYLRGSLSSYLGALKTTYSTAGPNAKPILAGAITSTEVLLSSPQFSN